MVLDKLIFVDCEGHGPAPGEFHNEIDFEFGAVHFTSKATFHGKGANKRTFTKFNNWLSQFEKPVFISDNPCYDYQFINYYFHKFLGQNPFGWSGRRIGDFYAGLTKKVNNTQEWKKWRITPHNHDPVFDSLGNVEAFERILKDFNLNGNNNGS